MSSKSKRFTAAMVIRKIMIPPVMAAVFFTVLLFLKKGTFVFAADYIAAMIGIVIFPVLAYPVSLLAPALREKGREGQRNLAFIFSAAGYVLTFLYALQPGRSDAFRLITLIYVLSVAMLLFFNKVTSSPSTYLRERPQLFRLGADDRLPALFRRKVPAAVPCALRPQPLVLGRHAQAHGRRVPHGLFCQSGRKRAGCHIDLSFADAALNSV